MTTQIEVWDATDAMNPKLIHSNSKTSPPGSNPDADKCFANVKKIDEFFRKFVPDSTHKLMRVFINHPNAKYENGAHWDSPKSSVFFGKHAPGFFNPFVENLDVTTHEFTHAVIQELAFFDNSSQSGSLDESIADVFAIMHKHYLAKVSATSPDANWNIGEGLLVYAEGGNALRSLSNPGKAFTYHPILGNDKQVDHMDKYSESAGKYANAGIPNKAFYLAATNIGGGSWEKAGLIWCEALKNAKTFDTFEDFAKRTIIAAKTLGYRKEIEKVRKAWNDVGINVPPEPEGDSWATWFQKNKVTTGILATLLVAGSYFAFKYWKGLPHAPTPALQAASRNFSNKKLTKQAFEAYQN